MRGGHLSHAQSHLVTREELMAIPPPLGTPTWRPIAHGDLIVAIERQLMARGISILEQKFAIQREGARLFAVLDLSLETTEEFCAAMGIRTSNDRSMALEVAVGIRVFVCDNLAFSGDLIALRRKHTARFDLDADIARAMGRYEAHLLAFQRSIAGIRETPLADPHANAMICEAFRREILPVRFFKQVTNAYFDPAPHMTDVQPRTLWGLHNAFSRAIRDMAPAPAFQATTELGKFFGLRARPDGGETR
jgi:hypothetical protein